MQRHVAAFVYGATDGVVATFAIIAGTIGAQLQPVVVLLLGVSNVLADGFSMAASNYLSAKSESELGEGKKLVRPFQSALVTFLAFVLVGSVPLVPFILARIIPELAPYQFQVAILGTSLAFLFIGAMRGRVTKRSSILVSLETLFVGGIAALIAYGVGSFINNLLS